MGPWGFLSILGRCSIDFSFCYRFLAKFLIDIWTMFDGFSIVLFCVFLYFRCLAEFLITIYDLFIFASDNIRNSIFAPMNPMGSHETHGVPWVPGVPWAMKSWKPMKHMLTRFNFCCNGYPRVTDTPHMRVMDFQNGTILKRSGISFNRLWMIFGWFGNQARAGSTSSLRHNTFLRNLWRL